MSRNPKMNTFHSLLYVMSQGKRATLTKLDEYELLIPLHSSYYKDNFRTFAVQIAYSSAEIKLR